VAFLALVAPVCAQDSTAMAREGFMIGFAVGFGASYPCDTCPSVAGSFHVGAMAGPRVAVLADISAVGGGGDSVGDEGRGLGVLALGARFWPAERFWLQGGIGISAPLDSDFDTVSDRSWAGIVGAGFEVAQKGRFAMDVQLRGAFADGRQSVAVGIGFGWH
jgi:hypothetical protein